MAQFAMIAIGGDRAQRGGGQAGLLDLGYVGFYAVGAYTGRAADQSREVRGTRSAHGMFSEDWAWLSWCRWRWPSPRWPA